MNINPLVRSFIIIIISSYIEYVMEFRVRIAIIIFVWLQIWSVTVIGAIGIAVDVRCIIFFFSIPTYFSNGISLFSRTENVELTEDQETSRNLCDWNALHWLITAKCSYIGKNVHDTTKLNEWVLIFGKQSSWFFPSFQWSVFF